MDNSQLFTHKSDDYSRFRPSYPDASIDWLYAKCGNCRVLDVGAGTGIFTQALLKRFRHVTALEPNAAMREKFSVSLPDIVCSDGSGENTKLPDNSADLITVAQAFHWLDEEQFKEEAKRILHPDGRVAVIWNNSIKNEFTVARDEVCRKSCPRFRGGHAGKRTAAEGDDFLRNRYFQAVEVITFPNPFAMDLAGFEGNMRSRSYTPTPKDDTYTKFMDALRDVFAQYAQNGIVIEPVETQIYLGSF